MDFDANVFSQPWWLDAVAPNSWGEVTVEKGGEIVGRLPYAFRKQFGFKLLMMPPLTQNFKPWLHIPIGKMAARKSEEKQLLNALIDQLPKFDLFKQNYHHSFSNWLPFYWKGFQQTTRYTYIIPDLIDLDLVWQNFRSNIKTDVRKAQKYLSVRSDLPLDTLMNLVEKTFQRQKKSLPYHRELVIRLDHACGEHNCRKMFFAVDTLNQVHAAVYVVWDENSAYYLMGGADPDLRNSGATSLCLWSAIQFAATVTQTFDFEGSMIEPVERFFRAFGALQIPYFQINKVNSLPIMLIQNLRVWKQLRKRGRRI